MIPVRPWTVLPLALGAAFAAVTLMGVPLLTILIVYSFMTTLLLIVWLEWALYRMAHPRLRPAARRPVQEEPSTARLDALVADPSAPLIEVVLEAERLETERFALEDGWQPQTPTKRGTKHPTGGIVSSFPPLPGPITCYYCSEPIIRDVLGRPQGRCSCTRPD